jgi:hypothetical protein
VPPHLPHRDSFLLHSLLLQPAIATLGGLDGRSTSYRWATPGQQAQAVLWLAQQLHEYFPTLSVTVWSQAFHRFQPRLWEDSDGISLDYQDLARFAQRLTTSSLVPNLDPPICCEDACFLAEVYQYMRQVATGLHPELEASFKQRPNSVRLSWTTSPFRCLMWWGGLLTKPS